jgi:hypothetical protein
MNNQSTLFAFRLSQKKTDSGNNGTWKARDAVAIAGCTAVGVATPRYLGDIMGNDTATPCT